MTNEFNTVELPVGVVGLGLMGCSITACLLMAGHPVSAIAPVSTDLLKAEERIHGHLAESYRQGLTIHPPEYWFSRLHITENYTHLIDCVLVIECTLEDVNIKKAVYEKIELIIGMYVLRTSNTSAISISLLQKHTLHPSRFFGLQWA